MRVNLKVRYEDRTLRIAQVDNLFLACWSDAPTGPQMRQLGEHSRAFQDEHGPDTAMWDAIVAGTPKFAAEVRDEAASLTADEELFPLGTAHVVLLDGFKGTATRAFLTTAMLLGRPRHATKVFGNLDSAARWINECLQRGPDRNWDLQRVLDVHQALTRDRI